MTEEGVAERPTIGAVARLALWLGAVGFGGSFAVIAQLEGELVRRKRWFTDGEYVEAVNIAQSLPGASAANVFTQLGLRAGGVWGAALATAAFILPSALIMVGFGIFYEQLHRVPEVTVLFAGMNAAMVGIVAGVTWKLSRGLRETWQLVVAAVVLIAIELEWVGVLEATLLACFGGLILAGYRRAVREAGTGSGSGALKVLTLPVLIALLPKLAAFFLRIGAVTFGGGLAMIPVLEHELVGQLGWLSRAEFSDAVTLGLVTPGPVAVISTFVGYRIAGVLGALVATVATFTPAFAGTVAVTRSIAVFRRSALVMAVLAVLAPVVAGTVAAASVSLGRHNLNTWVDVVIGVASFFAVVAMEVPALAVLGVAALLRASSSALG